MGTETFDHLLKRVQRGDRIAENVLYKISFSRLRLIASSLLRRETSPQTLQPTALVSELFLKVRRLELRILGETHFYNVSARAMRQVLIDRGRAKRAAKKIPRELITELLPDSALHTVDPDLHMAVRQVFESLRRFNPKAAQVVWLRAVECMTTEEVGRIQGRSLWHVRADYEFGIAWMADWLRR